MVVESEPHGVSSVACSVSTLMTVTVPSRSVWEQSSPNTQNTVVTQAHRHTRQARSAFLSRLQLSMLEPALRVSENQASEPQGFSVKILGFLG